MKAVFLKWRAPCHSNIASAQCAIELGRTMALVDEALADLIKRNEALMSKLNDGTASRDDHRALDATMTEIERRNTESSALATMTRAELMRRNEALMAKVKAGTATRADTEQLNNTMAAIAAEDQERTAIKLEASTMDTKSLMERNAELMRKLSAGTATRAETTKLEATMAAIEKAKADADAMRTIEARDELIRRNEALMAKVKAGTATRADKEKADLSTLEIKRRKSTEESIAKETEVDELLRRNAALMKTMKEGTATRADREELEAVMRRKEELDKELGETKARETKAKLDAARGELRLTERKTAVRDVMRMIKESERTDLCFMIDATGSMGKHIEAVKTQIVKIATDVQKTNPHLQLRVAITGYRDRVDCPKDTNSPFDFTDSLETFVSNVSSIRADGGGDGCEDVSSGISDVLRFSWSSPTRVLFFIADAPSHGARYHDGCNDNHTSGDHGIPEKLKKLVAMNIDIVFCSINDSITAKMIRVMNSDLGGSPIKTVPLGDPSALTKHATATLRKSMHKTFTASRGRTTKCADAELRAFVLTPAPPAWELLPALDAKLYMNKEVIDIASLKSSGPLETMLVGFGTAVRGLFSSSSGLSASKASGEASCERCQIKVAPEPFNTGNLRLARFGQIMTSGGSGGSSATWQPCVFKDFKSKDAKDHLLERYLEEMEVNSVASALAAEFNRTQRPPANRQIRYVLSSVATVETAKGSRTYFAEPFLEGSFTRFSYNTGPWEEDRLDPWLLRFALWTYEVTGGFLMVADLQGIQSDQGFVLTDPVILSTDLRRFGNTNLGGEMMERCKASAEAHLFTMTGGKFSMARSSPRSGDFLSLLEAAEKRDEAVTAILSSKEPLRSRGSPVSSSPPSPKSVTHALSFMPPPPPRKK